MLNWLTLLNQDVGLIDFDDYRHSGVNITAFRLIDPTNPRVVEVTRVWANEQKLYGNSALENERGIRASVIITCMSFTSFIVLISFALVPT